MSEEYLSNGFLFDASRQQKEEFLIFSIMVAGKGADRTWKVVKKFLALYNPEFPFRSVQNMIDDGRLRECLEEARTGQYNRLCKALPELIQIDPEECTLEDLEKIHGIGKKTSRFYKLYTDPEFEGIPLDTHLLKFLNDIGIEAPRSTPQSSKRYKELEEKLIKLYHDSKPYTGLESLSDFDYFIWWHYYKGNQQAIINNFKWIYENTT